MPLTVVFVCRAIVIGSVTDEIATVTLVAVCVSVDELFAASLAVAVNVSDPDFSVLTSSISDQLPPAGTVTIWSAIVVVPSPA